MLTNFSIFAIDYNNYIYSLFRDYIKHKEHNNLKRNVFYDGSSYT